MDISYYVDRLSKEFDAAATAMGDDARSVAQRLVPSFAASLHLVLLDALSAAADEITRELAPGAVELRLSGGQPRFVLNAPSTEVPEVADPLLSSAMSAGSEDAGTARLNLRLSEIFKQRIEEAARNEGVSLNTWLIRAAGAELERTGSSRPRASRDTGGSKRFTGWVR